MLGYQDDFTVQLSLELNIVLVVKYLPLTAMQLFCMFDLNWFLPKPQNCSPVAGRKQRQLGNLGSLVLLLSLTKADTEPLVLVGRIEKSSISYFGAFPHVCPCVHSLLSSFCVLSDPSTELTSAKQNIVPKTLVLAPAVQLSCSH